MALASLSLIGLSSCSEDDEPVPVQNETERTDLVLSNDVQRVKIGAENRVKLEVAQGNGNYHAYSLNPDIANVVKDSDGAYYIEGFKNGQASVVVSDAENIYKRMQVSVYTTDVMKLSHDEFLFSIPLGYSESSTACSVVEGNGGYVIETDNAKVSVSIDAESGAITLSATAGKDEYSANLKITDSTGLSATMTVTVSATLDAFTDNLINELLAKTANDWYIKSNLFTYTRCSVLPRYEDEGEWKDEDNGDGTWTFGWWESMGYGGHYIHFPSGTAVGVEVDATYDYKHAGYTKQYSMPGKAKIIKDDEESKVVIWWNVDLENECINRGWIVRIKSNPNNG